jgi:hypothetical protein
VSMNALILGTVDFLRDKDVGLGLGAEICDEQPDGQPPPWDGETYYAVTESGEWTNDARRVPRTSYSVWRSPSRSAPGTRRPTGTTSS